MTTLTRPGLSTVEGSVRLAVGTGRRSSRWTNLALRAAAPVAVLVLWWVAGRLGWITEQTLAPPGTVWRALRHLVATGELWDNAVVSLRRAGLGLALGGGTGLLLGVLTGFTRLGDRLLDPLVQMLRTVPFLALAPLFVVWFGIDEQPKILLIAVGTAFPLYLNTHAGVRQVDPKVLEAARVYGLSRLRLVAEIVLPAALPALLVGLRVALGGALLGLIMAEQINASAGLGFLMQSAQDFFQTDILVVCIVIYAAWGLLADLLVRLLERVLMPWQRGGRR